MVIPPRLPSFQRLVSTVYSPTSRFMVMSLCRLCCTKTKHFSFTKRCHFKQSQKQPGTILYWSVALRSLSLLLEENSSNNDLLHRSLTLTRNHNSFLEPTSPSTVSTGADQVSNSYAE
ncbi:unnamed protein product [Linum trigynum]|uniref:Uncharacterized protein n=1 Tax=Linum trigynum TaxID=586398 RepID=A0AAV2GU12_9ROSI